MFSTKIATTLSKTSNPMGDRLLTEYMSNILCFVNSSKHSITNSWHLLKGTKISSLMPKGPLMGSCAIVQRGLLFPKYPVTQFSNLSGMSLLFAGPSYFLHQCNIQICTRPSHCDARDNIFDTKACNLKNILRTDIMYCFSYQRYSLAPLYHFWAM